MDLRTSRCARRRSCFRAHRVFPRRQDDRVPDGRGSLRFVRVDRRRRPKPVFAKTSRNRASASTSRSTELNEAGVARGTSSDGARSGGCDAFVARGSRGAATQRPPQRSRADRERPSPRRCVAPRRSSWSSSSTERALACGERTDTTRERRHRDRVGDDRRGERRHELSQRSSRVSQRCSRASQRSCRPSQSSS